MASQTHAYPSSTGSQFASSPWMNQRLEGNLGGTSMSGGGNRQSDEQNYAGSHIFGGGMEGPPRYGTHSTRRSSEDLQPTRSFLSSPSVRFTPHNQHNVGRSRMRPMSPERSPHVSFLSSSGGGSFLSPSTSTFNTQGGSFLRGESFSSINQPKGMSSHLSGSRKTKVGDAPPVTSIYQEIGIGERDLRGQDHETGVKPYRSGPLGIENSQKMNNMNDSMLAEDESHSKHERWVTIFGFPSSSLTYVLRHFQQFGDIVQHIAGTHGNWVHVQFQTRLQAQMALARNGTCLAGSLLIGVSPLNIPSGSDDSLNPLLSAENLEGEALPEVLPLNHKRIPQHDTQGRSLYQVDNAVEDFPHPDRSFFSKVMHYVFGW